MKKLVVSSLLGLSLSSYAINISVTPSCGTVNQTICDQLTSEVESLLNEDTPDVSIGDYGTGLANAGNFAYKGLGSDYSDVFDYFMVRGGAGIAVDGEIDKPESADGVGIGAAATVGINLDVLPVDKIGPVELEKMDLFVSFMSYSPDQDLEDTTFKGDVSHFGLMARYQIMEGKDFIPGNMLSWGGLFLHTGFQRSSIEADFTQSFNDETVDIGGGQTANLVNTSANFNFETSSTSIPVEVSTYLRTAWAFTFFGGAGFDFVQGSTDVSLSASGTADGTGPVDSYSATIQADESDSGDADATNFRAFGGLQLNLPFFRVTAHVNKGLGNDLLGVNVGAKILW